MKPTTQSTIESLVYYLDKQIESTKAWTLRIVVGRNPGLSEREIMMKTLDEFSNNDWRNILFAYLLQEFLEGGENENINKVVEFCKKLHETQIKEGLEK